MPPLLQLLQAGTWIQVLWMKKIHKHGMFQVEENLSQLLMTILGYRNWPFKGRFVLWKYYNFVNILILKCLELWKMLSFIPFSLSALLLGQADQHSVYIIWHTDPKQMLSFSPRIWGYNPQAMFKSRRKFKTKSGKIYLIIN